MNSESALREELVKACRVLYAVKAAGDGLGGHLSARLDEQRILIKPRPVGWWRLKPEDLIVIDFHGKRVDGPASQRTGVREWPIHAQIYRARPDVVSVIHSHSHSIVPLSVVKGMKLKAIFHMAGFVGQGAPVFEIREAGGMTDMLVRTPVLGQALARTLGDKPAALMRGHSSTAPY